MENEKRTLYYHNNPMVIFEQVTIQNRKFVKLNCSNFIARAQDLISRCEISLMFLIGVTMGNNFFFKFLQ